MLEKRGNSEIEVKCISPGNLIMILPGSNVAVNYDGRFDRDGMEKTASLQVGQSIFVPVTTW